jgi:hypothetical protein
MKHKAILSRTVYLCTAACFVLVMIVSTLSPAEQPKPASPHIAPSHDLPKTDPVSLGTGCFDGIQPDGLFGPQACTAGIKSGDL